VNTFLVVIVLELLELALKINGIPEKDVIKKLSADCTD
jgi:hypothetical protein